MISEEQRQHYLSLSDNGRSLQSYIEVLVEEKAQYDILGWQDIADLVEEAYDYTKSRHWYYRNYGSYYDTLRDDFLHGEDKEEETVDTVDTDSFQSKLLELQKEKVKISDERTQTRAYIRRLAREDTLKEIALQAVENMSAKKLLPTISSHKSSGTTEEEALLILSDWHYGMDFSLPWNTYNPKIARERIAKLLNETIQYCEERDIDRIHVMNLSDLIAGRIHLTIRLESRIDTITQTMEVSEILSEFLNELANHFEVEYYSCIDNHSRLEPNKADSLDLESLCRITDWYLRSRLSTRVIFHNNTYGNDIITTNILGHNIAGVHGHLDKPQKCIEDISLITRQSYDLICMAHLHHFSMDEKCGCRIIGVAALMGTDSFSSNLRLHSKPSQTIVIVSKRRVCEDIHIVELD